MNIASQALFYILFHFFSNGLKTYEYKNIKSKSFGSFLKKEEYGKYIAMSSKYFKALS